MANNIKEILELLEIQQLEIAEKLSISKQTLHYNLTTHNPKKYNKQIATLLGIQEYYLIKDGLSALDRLEIQKQYSLNCDNADDKYLSNLEQEIEEESFFDEIKNLIISSELNLWFFEILTKYLKKCESVEFAILKKYLLLSKVIKILLY